MSVNTEETSIDQTEYSLSWAFVPSIEDIKGNQLGYGLSNINLYNTLKKYTEVKGRTAKAKYIIHLCHPNHYRRVPGKVNILYSMTEHNFVNSDFKTAFEFSDVIVVPTNYCKEVFSQYTNKPIFVCPLGLDPKVFTYKKRKWRPDKGEPFVWLYVGAPNKRKFSILEEIWSVFLRPFGKNVQLYIKTTGADVQQDITQVENWTVDNRKISDGDLAKLYHSAHGFILPHLGEGFGLSLLEAMATGLPSVVSDHTGTQDFADHTTAYPVRVKEGDVGITIIFGGVVQEMDIRCGIPVLSDAIRQMGKVMLNYDEATYIAKCGSTRAREMTWDNTAKKILSIIKELDSSSVNVL